MATTLYADGSYGTDENIKTTTGEYQMSSHHQCQPITPIEWRYEWYEPKMNKWYMSPISKAERKRVTALRCICGKVTEL